MQKSMQSLWDTSILDGGNQAYLEAQYDTYLKNPEALGPEWKQYFEALPTQGNGEDVSHLDIRAHFVEHGKRPPMVQVGGGTIDYEHESKQAAVHDLINGYRLLGHLYSSMNPIKSPTSAKVPELELAFYSLSSADFGLEFDAGDLKGSKRRSLQAIINDLKQIYCGNVASEFMHIPDSAERMWVQEKTESMMLDLNFSKDKKKHILEGLSAAEGLEKYLGSKYPGAKRFGLEGCDSLIIALDEIIQTGGVQGVQEVVIGMAHRGRLNVLVNILGKMPRELFDEFEGKHSFEVESGDVKYHQGFSSDVKTAGGNVHLSLAFNPSHLEIVAPVASGSVRARQERRKAAGTEKVLAITIHGDAAFAGQGVVMETLNMSQTRGYGIGGSIRIIVNNQVGFTTSNPKDARSTLYCSDLGKMILAPIFHVNAEDPEAVSAVAELALAYRTKFNKDVIIDLVGFRRHGHNEADEPSATQPTMYQVIKKKPTARKIYADRLLEEGSFTQSEVDTVNKLYRESLDERDTAVAKFLVNDGWKSAFASDWSPYGARDWRTPTSTKVDKAVLQQLANARDTIPSDWKLHSRVKKIVEDRRKMTTEDQLVDWGYAETLAYASLLNDGYHVRLSGQDCGRGTFFHRHAVWHDQEGKGGHISLCHLNEQQGKFWVIDSLLSEAAVLGFEYGFSTSEPRTLIIWEGQFGDFANSAQVVIDQFISSGEQKWGRLSGLVMFLPHGFEGQGPEHSSARLERYLQLCAQHNIQVCVPSTPAQVYHMLRRQMLRPMRKPLIVMTPKSLLRHKSAVSSLDELANGEFQSVLPDTEVKAKKVTRVVLCSGKVYYELLALREEQKMDQVAIVRIEQLYPFPEIELKEELSRYSKAKDVIWCQEEPQNQGAWYSSQHHIRACLNGQNLLYAGREASAAPAVGYMHLHNKQQAQLAKDALGIQ